MFLFLFLAQTAAGESFTQMLNRIGGELLDLQKLAAVLIFGIMVLAAAAVKRVFGAILAAIIVGGIVVYSVVNAPDVADKIEKDVNGGQLSMGTAPVELPTPGAYTVAA